MDVAELSSKLVGSRSASTKATSVCPQGMDLLMYGDSVIESLLGNQMGEPRADWADIADVWNKHHGASKSKVLAISGIE